MKTKPWQIIALLSAIACVSLAQAQIVTLTPGAAATAIDNGPEDGVFDSFAPSVDFGSIDDNGYTSARTAGEFTLPATPPGLRIVSATLAGRLTNFEGVRSVALYGYGGDGVMELTDFSIGQQLAVQVFPPTGTTSFSVDVTTFISMLAEQGQTFAGFNVREQPPNSSNFTVMHLGVLPTLTIEYGAMAPPTIGKAFGAASVPLNGSTSLTFTIGNPNVGGGLTGVGMTDNLPAGLVVANPNGLTTSCGGTITAVAGTGSINLTGATLSGSASCTFGVNVTATTAGTKNNTTGAVTSVEGGAGGTASASVTVVGAAPLPGGPPPTNIPTLEPWALWALGVLILIVTAVATSRRFG